MTANTLMGSSELKLKAIMADDEAVARRFLKRNLQRLVPYVEVIGEASNGYELLSLLECTTADILMLDIMMPGLNGLEALQRLEGRTRSMKVIIISAHDRFDFAREALSLGVFDFLLKPVRPTDLMASIDKCAMKIVEERDIKESYVNLKKRTEITEKMAKASVLKGIVSGVPSATREVELWNGLELFDADLPQSMIVADVSGVVEEEVRGIISEWADVREAVWCMSGQGRVVILLKQDRDSYDKSCQVDWCNSLDKTVRELGSHIGQAISDKNTGEVKIAYVESVPGMGLACQYEVACKALNKAYMTGESVVKANTRIKSVSNLLEGRYEDEVFAIECKLADEVKSGTLQGTLALLDELVERAIHLDYGYGFLSLELATVITSVCKVAVDVTGKSRDMFALRNDMVQKLMQVGTLCGMVDVVRSCLKTIFETLEVDESSNDRLVLSAKAIIEERACEGLTLSEVASETFVSPSYLSRLFKDTCGMNFQDYLTEVRITKAKALLRNTAMPCRVIGQMVGYASSSYFSKIFKERTGQSPTEFRKSSR